MNDYAEQVFYKGSNPQKISVESTLNPSPGVLLVLHLENDRRKVLFIPVHAWERLRAVNAGVEV